MALATMRALAKVKSSAMMPRQPSVPNLIAVMSGGEKYTRSGIGAKQPDWPALEKILAPPLFEPFHYVAHLLGAVTGTDKESVGGFDNDEIAHANDSGE